jgi:hypothetical protein
VCRNLGLGLGQTFRGDPQLQKGDASGAQMDVNTASVLPGRYIHDEGGSGPRRHAPRRADSQVGGGNIAGRQRAMQDPQLATGNAASEGESTL